MIKDITNKNLKELLSKRKLTNEVLMEFKTAFFIFQLNEDNLESFDYDDKKVVYLFTSLNECFNDNPDLSNYYFYLDYLKNKLDNIDGVIINPKSDILFIPKSVIFHIIHDIDKNFDINKALFEINRNNRALFEYCRGKTTFNLYPRLFNYFVSSKLYVLLKSPISLDDQFDNEKLPLSDVDLSIYKKDSYIVIFTDKKQFMDEIKKEEGYFYYMSADVLDLSRIVFEFDYNGLILKTPNYDFILPRKNLLKHFDKICDEWVEDDYISQEYAFKIG